MDFIITWSDGLGRVGTGEYLYDIVEKPSLGFEFDAIYFETPTKMFVKLINGKQQPLTEEEISKCTTFCEDFYNSDSYPVHAIDPDLHTWVGFMPRGELKRQGLEEAVGATFPDEPYAKWYNGHWERVVAAIDELGGLWLLPQADNKRFNFVFTELEWAAFPKPSYDDEKYDFKTKSWNDTREFTSSLKLAKDKVRASFLSTFRDENLVHYEIDPVMYLIQYKEAMEYKSNKECSTPFIDAVISHTNDSKEAFVKRIMNHYAEDLLTRLGHKHGEQQSLLDKLSATSSLEELDAIALPLFANTKHPWRRPMKVQPYATAD